MIYTITLNPALDRTIRVNKTTPDDCNRIENEQMYAGGKGIDVSKVLTSFGVTNKALGFVGGFAGEELEGMLINEGVACDFVRISGRTRTNIIINDLTSGSQTLYNAKGPEITGYELMHMIHKVENFEQPEYVIISGSLPGGVNPEIYRKIIEISKSKGAKVVFDTDGEALRMGLRECPTIIKPNIHELSRISGQQLDSLDSIIAVASDMRVRGGPEIILVSMGCCGMLMICDRGKYLARPPEVTVKNTIGAGDSAVAGFIYGLTTKGDLKEALRCSVASGTATILQTGTAVCKQEDFHALLGQVVIEKV
jgi:6-phosphofructokinase 2